MTANFRSRSDALPPAEDAAQQQADHYPARYEPGGPLPIEEADEARA
jgi:hypothetical protein